MSRAITQKPRLRMNPSILDKRLEIPIIRLNPLPRHRLITRKPSRPITAPLRIVRKRRQPGIQITLTQGQRVLGSGLDGPFAHEDGELAIAGFLARVGAEEGGKVGG